jgi:hypothetical protein
MEGGREGGRSKGKGRKLRVSQGREYPPPPSSLGKKGQTEP